MYLYLGGICLRTSSGYSEKGGDDEPAAVWTRKGTQKEIHHEKGNCCRVSNLGNPASRTCTGHS